MDATAASTAPLVTMDSATDSDNFEDQAVTSDDDFQFQAEGPEPGPGPGQGAEFVVEALGGGGGRGGGGGGPPVGGTAGWHMSMRRKFPNIRHGPANFQELNDFHATSTHEFLQEDEMFGPRIASHIENGFAFHHDYRGAGAAESTFKIIESVLRKYGALTGIK